MNFSGLSIDFVPSRLYSTRSSSPTADTAGILVHSLFIIAEVRQLGSLRYHVRILSWWY